MLFAFARKKFINKSVALRPDFSAKAGSRLRQMNFGKEVGAPTAVLKNKHGGLKVKSSHRHGGLKIKSSHRYEFYLRED